MPPPPELGTRAGGADLFGALCDDDGDPSGATSTAWTTPLPALPAENDDDPDDEPPPF